MYQTILQMKDVRGVTNLDYELTKLVFLPIYAE